VSNAQIGDPAYSGVRAAAIRAAPARVVALQQRPGTIAARRCSWPSTLTRRCTTNRARACSRDLPGSSTAPPPVEITWSPPRSRSASAALSRARKPASPSHSKIVPTAAPVRSSTSRSASTKARPERSARRRPIDVLPRPWADQHELGAEFMRDAAADGVARPAWIDRGVDRRQRAHRLAD
jgi:hypothetical protein